MSDHHQQLEPRRIIRRFLGITRHSLNQCASSLTPISWRRDIDFLEYAARGTRPSTAHDADISWHAMLRCRLDFRPHARISNNSRDFLALARDIYAGTTISL